MQTVTITLGKKAQVVIPKKAREAIGVKEGSKATLMYEPGRIVIMGDPKTYGRLLRGLGKEIWKGNGDKHLEKERASWDRD